MVTLSEWDVLPFVSVAAGLGYVVFLNIALHQAKVAARRNGRLGAVGTRRLAIQMSVAACLFIVFGLGPFVLLGELPLEAVLLPLPFIALLQVGAAHYWAAWHKTR